MNFVIKKILPVLFIFFCAPIVWPIVTLAEDSAIAVATVTVIVPTSTTIVPPAVIVVSSTQSMVIPVITTVAPNFLTIPGLFKNQPASDETKSTTTSSKSVVSPLIKVHILKNDEVRLSWVTDEITHSVVRHGTTREYTSGQWKEDVFSYEHSIVLSGIRPGIAYYYQIIVYNRAQNWAMLEGTFSLDVRANTSSEVVRTGLARTMDEKKNSGAAIIAVSPDNSLIVPAEGTGIVYDRESDDQETQAGQVAVQVKTSKNEYSAAMPTLKQEQSNNKLGNVIMYLLRTVAIGVQKLLNLLLSLKNNF